MTLIIRIACVCGVQVVVTDYNLRWGSEKPVCATCAKGASA